MNIEVGIFAKRATQQKNMTDIARAWDTAEHDAQGGRLFVIARGTGRGKFGQIASEAAIYQVQERFYEEMKVDPYQPHSDALREVLNVSNEDMYERADKISAMGGFGAAVVAAALQDDHLTIAWVGTSRAYFLPADAQSAQQSTIDTMMGTAGAPMLLGSIPKVAVGVFSLDLEPGDTVILCTEGVYKSLSGKHLTELVRRRASMQMAAADVVNAALDANGGDNAAAIVLQLRGDDDKIVPQQPPPSVKYGDVQALVGELDLNVVSSETETQEIQVGNIFDDVHPEQPQNPDGTIPPFLGDDTDATDDDEIPAWLRTANTEPDPIDDDIALAIAANASLAEEQYALDDVTNPPHPSESDPNEPDEDAFRFEDDDEDGDGDEDPFAFPDADAGWTQVENDLAVAIAAAKAPENTSTEGTQDDQEADTFADEIVAFPAADDTFTDFEFGDAPFELDEDIATPPMLTMEDVDAMLDADDDEPSATYAYDVDDLLLGSTFDDLIAVGATAPDESDGAAALVDTEPQTRQRPRINQVSLAILLFSGVLMLVAFLVLGSALLWGEVTDDPVAQLPTVASIARDTATSTKLIVTNPSDKPTETQTTERAPAPTTTRVQIEVPNGWESGTVLYVTTPTGYRRDVFSPPLDPTQFSAGDEVVVSLARQTLGYREWYEYNGERWWFVDNIGWLAENELSPDPLR